MKNVYVDNEYNRDKRVLEGIITNYINDKEKDDDEPFYIVDLSKV